MDTIKTQVASKWQESFAKINGPNPGISGLITFSRAWTVAMSALRVGHIDSPDSERPPVQKESLRGALALIHHTRRLPTLLETYLENVRANFHFIEEEMNAFIEKFDETEDTQHIRDLVARVHVWLHRWQPPEAMGPSITKTFHASFCSHLFATLPPRFAVGFKQICAQLLAPAPDEDSSQLRGYQMTREDRYFVYQMHGLGLVERFETIIASVGYEFIEAYIDEKCRGEWEKPMLEEVRGWMSDRVVPWMVQIYAREASNTEEAKAMLGGIGSRFDFHINKTLCDLRIKEIFDIIIDFPDSMGALQDLRDCLSRVDQRNNLVKALRAANRKRLLQPAADTKLILSQYVSTIKCLRIVDPPGVLLFKVADPIRRYLRERPDTIRSIVANLVGDDENGDTLIDENEPPVPLQQQDVDDYTQQHWEPDPIDAGPEFRTNKPSDVISTLVSIYDSKDLFVRELQVLLAQRLLAAGKTGVDKVERERRNIEILKIRFGEAALQVCEVMLKDMTDSKRTDQHIQGIKPSVIKPTIISRNFWPTLENSDLTMPGQFQELQQQYAKEFAAFKPDKRLKWLPHLGTVQLSIELEDRTVDCDVPPLEAAFIELFSQKDVWSLDDLVKAVGSVDRGAAVKALSTWVDMGVLKEDPENTFVLLERAEEAPTTIRRDARSVPEPTSAIPPVQTVQQQQAEQMRVYWKFIEGMLTNLGSLPLDRIQTMLKYAPHYTQTIEQLAGFMEAARREGLVEVQNGQWRLNR